MHQYFGLILLPKKPQERFLKLFQPPIQTMHILLSLQRTSQIDTRSNNFTNQEENDHMGYLGPASYIK